MCTGTHYLGGYIGDNESKRDWLKERTLTWKKNINTISKTMGQYPLGSCATVVHAIQSEWIFLQCVTWNTGDTFAGVEMMIRETFLSRLFFGKTKSLSPVIETLSTMPVKKSGLGFLNPVTSAQENYLSYTQGSAELVRAGNGGGVFSNADNLQTLSGSDVMGIYPRTSHMNPDSRV